MAMKNETVDVGTCNFMETDDVHTHILSNKHCFSGQRRWYNNNNNNIYLLQLGCYSVAVVILHVNKT